MRPHLLRVLTMSAALLLPAVPVAVLAPIPALARPAPDSFADLAASLLPAVVNVASSSTVTAQNERGGEGGEGGEGGAPQLPFALPPGSPFAQFFHDFMAILQGLNGFKQRDNANGRFFDFFVSHVHQALILSLIQQSQHVHRRLRHTEDVRIHNVLIKLLFELTEGLKLSQNILGLS